MRILIAPHEIAGQMQILASTFRKLGYCATAVSYFEPNWLGYANDVNLGFRPKRDHTRRYIKMLSFALRAAVRFDVFHFFFGKSLFYNRHLDLPILKRLGKKIFVHFRGSEIRNDAHFAFKRQHGTGETPCPPIQTARQIELVEMWRKYADGIFVSTAELLELAPGAQLIPQVIDLDEWPVTASHPDTRVVKIAHAPTSRALKGTADVMAAVDSLRRKGLPVELALIEGLAHEQVRSLYVPCHLGVDQLIDGWHGNFSIEMMALGKPTVCFIEPRLRSHRPDLPLINTTPDTLVSVLEQLVTERADWARLGAQGRAYVEQRHCARKLCAELLALYERL
jgi:hypothetical protein